MAGESAILGIRYHRDPETAVGFLTRVMLLGQAVAQSTSIYALVIALVLLMMV
jgi:F0F1-type ATP synthase membrane subunit c/vacuolar-type H+-ATPase subunit K